MGNKNIDMLSEIEYLGDSRFRKGDYVIVGIQNAFNNKTSWWISKKDHTRACYCFTADSLHELRYQLKHIDSYIHMFNDAEAV